MDRYSKACSSSTDSSSDSSDIHTIDYQNRNMTLSQVENDFLNLFKVESAYAEIETVILYNNHLSSLPISLLKFTNLHTLDISNNNVATLNVEVFLQCPLRTLICKNNLLTNESLPKTFASKSKLGQLRELNLSGNMLTRFPNQLFELQSIKYLYLNGNLIQTIPKDIGRMKK
jgi:Leucine-rich repeat (LRR) protein